MGFGAVAIFEPTSFAAWGAQQAIAVEKVQSQTTSLKIVSGYTDTVTIMAGDDAEPAFDPGYRNTFDLMAGYSHAVDGCILPAMVDYGSADPGFWSNCSASPNRQWIFAKFGGSRIYSGADAKTWASLASYAKAAGTPLTIFGVLTATPAGSGFQTGPGDMPMRCCRLPGRSSLQWFSNIDP